MNIHNNVLPNGLSKCVLVGFDDGRSSDLQVIRTMMRYNIKGTFFINSCNIGQPGYLSEKEIIDISNNFEIAVHTMNHINMTNCPLPVLLEELIEDRRQLERITGKIVNGMAYPYGKVNERAANVTKNLGFAYARKSNETRKLASEIDIYNWMPTCHVNDELLKLGRELIETDWINVKGQCAVLFLTGHSVELQRTEMQDLFVRFCQLVGNRNDIWYATCMEYIQYCNAVERLDYSLSRERVYNPNAIDVWIRINGDPLKISAGETKNLEEYYGRQDSENNSK